LFKTTVIIPTYNRPLELENCLRSLLEQSVGPDEIIVVDDGALAELPLRRECEAAGIRCRYHRKKTPGLTASRNIGIAMATGEIIFFLDDDVVLLPNYLAEIFRVFEDYKDGDLGGVGGVIANRKPMTFFRRIRVTYDIIFMITGIREGRVLPSGFCADYGKSLFALKRLAEVDFLPGGVSAFKREVFDDFSFSEEYQGYGLGEDKDFSFRVAGKYKLIINPAAGLYHYESVRMRPDKFMNGREAVLSRFYFFRRYCNKGWLSTLFFSYALVGYIIARAIIMCLSFDRSEAARVRGIFSAVRDIIGGRITGR